MDAPLKFPNSPGTPLFPLSPERVNGSRPPYGAVPLSPSLPDFVKPSDFELNPTSPKKTVHSRNNSEALVQGMVARFDSLSLKDHQQMHRRDEVAIKRAELAREMAEMELKKTREEREERENDAKRWREECRKLKKEAEESKERERKLMKRLEAQADDVERTAKTSDHQRAVLEKDTRRLRKEAYKTESALVKLQEELKATRNSLRVAQSSMESEKAKSMKKEQEAFAAEYKLVGVQEELSKANERIKVTEEERDALKTNLENEAVARIAAEGHIALPTCADDDDEFASPSKSPRKKALSPDAEDKENVVPARTMEIRNLREELRLQRKMRERAEDQVQFMKMECQFQCCSCRVVEQRGGRYVHDDSFGLEMEKIRQNLSQELLNSLNSNKKDSAQATPDAQMEDRIEQDNETRCITEAEDDEQQMTYDDQTGTFRSVVHTETSKDQSQGSRHSLIEEPSSDALPSTEPEMEDADETVLHRRGHDDATANEQPLNTSSSLSDEESSDVDSPMLAETPRLPHTPKYREVRTVTTTTTIPLAFTPSSTPAPAAGSDAPMTPATIAHPPTLKAHPASSFSGIASPGAALRPDGTLDREAALEQIRLRRGRARSIAMGLGTPKKQMVEGVVRRDISAPALKGR